MKDSGLARATFAAVALALIIGRCSALSPAAFDETAPIQLVGKVQHYPYDYTLGNIGIIPYNRTLTGTPYIVTKGSCSPFAPSVDPSNADRVFIMDEKDGGTCTPFQRILNAAQAGAAAIVLLAPDYPGQPDVLSVNDNRGVNNFSASYWQPRIRVPVGRIHSQPGRNLLSELDNSTQVLFNFTDCLPTVDPSSKIVDVQLWNDADDSCGYPCIRAQEFLTDMAYVVLNATAADTQLSITPHWLLADGCAGKDPTTCSQHCVAGNRYCYNSLSTDDISLDAAGDLAVAQETVRRICLWYTMLHPATPDKNVFWNYLLYFFDQCKSSNNKYNEDCSNWAVDQTSISDADKQSWQQCYKQMYSDQAIAPVDQELLLAKGNNAASIPYIERLFRGSVRINDYPFRGSPHANVVMQTACDLARTANPTAPKPFVCQTPVPGACYLPGYNVCQDAANVAAHTTQCVVSASGAAQCVCEVGWQLDPKTNTCVDVNECADPNGDVCPYDGTRNVCINTVGGYQCLEYPDVCATSGRGGCWQSSDKTLSACKDNLDQVRVTAQNGFVPAVSSVAVCDCGAVGGESCWTGGGVLNGVEQCKEVSCVNVGAIVGGVIGGFLFLVIIVAIVVFVIHRRRSGKGMPNMKGFVNRSMGNITMRSQMAFSKFDDGDLHGRDGVKQPPMEPA